MSRHRDIRGKNYDEDYHGYDDVYGHSVEDEYGVSPGTAEQFLYKRERGHQELSSYLEDIGEDDGGSDSEQPLADSKNYQRPELSEVDEVRLQSCLDEIRNVVGDTTPEHVLVDAVIANNFNYEKALDAILNKQENNHKQSKGPSASKTGPQRLDNFPEPDPRLRLTPSAVDEAASQITRLTFAGKEAKQGFAVTVEDTGRERGDGELLRIGGAEAAPKGTLSPTRSSEGSLSRRSSRESLPYISSEPDLQAFGSATSTPSRKEGRKANSIDIAKELEKRQAGKDLLNLVVIGHVDAGKSTLMGHVLYLLGQVNQRVMHKYETESRKQGKASFAYAWVLDETGEERERGITMDVGLTRFETSHRLVTLLDAPGHKDFIPNMITGAAQADAAILVVDATRGEFETGFESGGQTREHALLVRSLGVRQLVVGVNKLDTVSWSEDRFRDIVKKLGAFLKQAGFKESDVVYIPCSGLTGENLTEKAKEPNLTAWYKGTCLLEQIDKLKPPKRSIEQALRLCVSDVFKGMGSGVSVTGKIETGNLQIGEKIIVMPSGENGLIKGITVHEEDTRWACAGDHTTLTVTGIDQMNLTIGSVICSYSEPIRATTRFQARVVIFDIEVPLTKGFPVLIHYQSVSEPAVLKKLISVLHKSTGEVIQKKPKCLTKQMNAIIEIATTRPVCLELYKDCKELGRFMLRYGGHTIAAGIVTEIKN